MPASASTTLRLAGASLAGALLIGLLAPAGRAQSAGGFVRYDITSTVALPDASTVDSLVYVDGVGSPILDVRVFLHITHPAAADLDISLIGPDGTAVELTSDNGGGGSNYGSSCTPDSARTQFDDSAATGIVDGAAPFVGAFRPEQPLSAFAGKTGSGAANGIWRLRIADDTAGGVGTLRCWSLLITAATTAPTALDDAYATLVDTPVMVPAPGVLANDARNGGGELTAATVSSPTHGFLAFNSNGSFLYTPSTGFVGSDSFAYRAFNGIGSVGSNVATVHLTVAAQPPTAIDDAYATAFQTPLTVPALGVLANDTNPVPAFSMTAGLVSNASHGTVALGADGGFTYVPAAGYAGPDSFAYRAIGVGGVLSNTATVSLTVAPPRTAQAPAGLRVSTVAGNVVTLRWSPPPLGPVPTQYVLEGGLAAGQVLASIPTSSPYPIFSFVAPRGSFYVRMHALVGADKSAPSNEVRLHVDVPVPPSAPAGLLSSVDGSALHLAWQNTFEGGPPGGLLLEVSGAYAGVLPLGRSDTLSVANVPAGTYALRLYAANGAGVSSPTSTATVTVPASCTGVPQVPRDFLAYRTGRTITVVWEPATTGGAPTSYLLIVGGPTFAGAIPTAARALSGTVGPGEYQLSVLAANGCGQSAATRVQTVVVP